MWTEQDVELALGWQHRKAKSCPSCGTMPEEWEANRFAYVTTTRACPGCEIIAQERGQIREETREYVHIGLKPNVGDDDEP